MEIIGLEEISFSSINNVFLKLIFVWFLFSNYSHSVTTNTKQTIVFIPEWKHNSELFYLQRKCLENSCVGIINKPVYPLFLPPMTANISEFLHVSYSTFHSWKLLEYHHPKELQQILSVLNHGFGNSHTQILCESREKDTEVIWMLCWVHQHPNITKPAGQLYWT